MDINYQCYFKLHTAAKQITHKPDLKINVQFTSVFIEKLKLYYQPLGPAPERPRTSAGTRGKDADDDFADEEIGDDLLPE